MNKKTEAYQLFSPSGCLTRQTMLSMAGDTPPSKDFHAAWLHIKSCDFCREALNGIMQADDKKIINNKFESIDKEIRKNLSEISLKPAALKKKPKLNKVNLYAAAAIILLIMGLFLVVKIDVFNIKKQRNDIVLYSSPFDKNHDKNIITNKDYKSEYDESSNMKDINENNFNYKKEIIRHLQEESKGKKQIQNIAYDDNFISLKDKNKTTNKHYAITAPIIKKASENNIKFSVSETSKNLQNNYHTDSVAYSGAAAVTSELVSGEYPNLKITARKTELNNEMDKKAEDLYYAGKYNEAINYIKTIKNDSDKNISENVLLGLSYYKLYQYSEAIPVLEKALQGPSLILRDEVQWALANSYIKTGQNEKAKLTLKNIILKNNIYKKAAETELEKL